MFAPLLEVNGLASDKPQCLRDAAFFENIGNMSEAARKVGSVLAELDKPLRGASGLFRPTLRKRLEWTRKPALSDQQQMLALCALERGDLLRAVIFGLESFISRQCEAKGQSPLGYKLREQADKALQEAIKARDVEDSQCQAYCESQKSTQCDGAWHGGGHSIFAAVAAQPGALAQSLAGDAAQLQP